MITIPIYGTSQSDAHLIQKRVVSDLYKQMKEQTYTPTRSVSSAANLTSLCVDISPSLSNFFEVLYIGKIKVWQKKVPESFVDDALEKFRTHELEKFKGKQLGSIGRLKSESDIIRRGSSVPIGALEPDENPARPLPRRLPLGHIGETARPAEAPPEPPEPLPESNDGNNNNNNNNDDDDGKSVNMDDHNRTMVLQIDRTDLRLISPDRKIILLHKKHKDITTCVQGLKKPDYFGFVCKEGTNSYTFVGYIFKCESSSIATDAMAAINQAFSNVDSRPRANVTSCEHCPMVWYHKLCVEVENMSDRKTQAAILRRIEQLDEDEQTTVLTKFRGAETDSVREQNEFLMMLLRAHCESKQARHVHDTAENRSEFLNQYLGGSTIFTKAKRSLSNSFDQLLKRKASKDDFGATLKGLNLPISKESSPCVNDESDKESEGGRSRSSTIGSKSDLTDLSHLSVRENSAKLSVSPDKNLQSDKGPKSPMMDIFLKVGNTPKAPSIDLGLGSSGKPDAGSWRQAIFKRVAAHKGAEPAAAQPTRRRTKDELKVLWKKSIYQAILLARMEKENARIRAEQEESAVKRIKLEYDDMRAHQRDLEVWEMVANRKDSPSMRLDTVMLAQAIRQGVPRGKRGDAWLFLAERYSAKTAPVDSTKCPNYYVPYDKLLKQLTSHQHAILIDLGRTFPNHSYFSSPLGPGQLALFNLLKAYSLLDPDVGYCQGLSFVAGVLLLHLEESQAFALLKHLMFQRGMRAQYLPDMVSLQIKLYQLSRLIRDQLPDIYEHFDFYEVAPTLYAAPWLLTVFASQFPLGFVARMFDMILLEGPEVIFKVALALLNHHKDKLLLCDSFEEIMNYLKIQLPNIDKFSLEKIMKQVYITDVSRQLNEYKVEYQVLQEEMNAVQPQVEALHKLEAQNKQLTDQNKSLTAQLEAMSSNVQRLEKTRALQQSQLNKLEMQNRGLDVAVSTLGAFVLSLIDDKVDVEIPDDVQRVLYQLNANERAKPKQNNLLKMFQRSPDKTMQKSQSMSLITVPTNADGSRLRTQSLSQNAEKVSKFFSNSHHSILQQRHGQLNGAGAGIDITVQEFEDAEEGSRDVDSGVGTPVTPKESHPLSNCDVSFTFNGTRELKSLKNFKSLRQCGGDIMSK
ncbi:unnamed protein product [Phyllotreta striolata]|uniref:Rab-GAP TBC domain-containing protein n=1 Tax=Phyllotreta striolata TaxID=444603 RepID=A0A9N9TJY4_PHYSR|nr:unnamed protein product [Phyllotreta striolata]